MFGLHRDTVRKMLVFSVPPGYLRQSPPKRPKLEPFTGVIDRILEDDLRRPRKQRHTAKRIFERLREEYRFDGQYTIVKDYVREHRRQSREMFVPLSHAPGHAQCDFGEALVVIGGVEQKAHCFVIDLPHSDGCFVKAYPAETTEAFLDGHVSAFAYLGGVPQSILYDNTRLAVAKILGDGRRKRTRAFTELQSHYLFEDRFGRPGKGNDKGKVEGLVGYVRRNFLVPIPSFANFEALNTYLEQRCLERMDAKLRGHSETIGQRMERDLEVLLPLPPVAYDACEKQAGRVSSLSLVRYRTNDYSAPVAYGHRDVLVRGYVDQVVISCGSEVIAKHHRSYERDDFVYDPIHYLPLLERKPGALDQAAPLQSWELPEDFGTLRRLLESRMGRRGKREFVQVLRLLETFSQQEVHSALKDALRLGALSFDAVKHLVLCRIGGTAAPPRPGTVSLPAPGEGEHHIGQGLHALAVGESGMNDRSTLLLEHHLKELKLPSFLPGIREDGGPVRRGGCGPPNLSAAAGRTGAHRPKPADGGAADPGGPLPSGQELGHLRLYRHPLGEQVPGDGTGPVRIHPAPGEYHRRLKQRHRQDPHGPGAGPGRLPAGDVRGLHRRRRPGPRVDGGQRREASA